jgi:uncharacterized delta-60 repeat protein
MAALAATMIAGCGDDEDGPKGGQAGDAGDGGTAGSKAGNNTGGSKAGNNTGGTAGSKAGSDTGGSGGAPMAGEGGGGSGPDPVGGAGAGGEGGEPTFDAITKVSDEVFTEASDLRGLRYSATGGKLWAAGHLGINTNVDNKGSQPGEPDKKLVIARFTADGAPDTTFSDDGFLEVNLVEREEDDTDPLAIKVVNDGNEEALGIVELENGDIVVSGNKRDANGKGMDAYLARFTSAGVPVNEFGTAGVAIVTFGWAPADDASWTATSPTAPSDNSWGLELDNKSTPGTEKLVVFGAGTAVKGALTASVQRTDNDRYVTRVLATTGAIDPEFNGAKPFTYHTGGTNGDNGRRGIVLADGSILAGGYTNITPGGNHIIAIKLKSDGTRDMDFGHIANDRGIIRSNPVIDDGGAAECYAIAVQSSGRIVTTGYGSATAAATNSRFGYLPTKAPDLVSFAYKADGSGMDTGWGNVGMFIGQSEELAVARFEERGRDMVVLPDDRLVYVGNFATDPAIYVVTPDGEFDPANDVGQLLRYDTTTGAEPRLPVTVTVNASGTTSTSTSHFYRVVVSPDGKRIAASTNQNIKGSLLTILKVGE